MSQNIFCVSNSQYNRNNRNHHQTLNHCFFFFSIFRESSLNTSEKENDESKLSSGSLAHFYDVAVPGEDDDDEDDNDLSRDNSLDDLQQQQQVRLFYLFIVSVTFS